MLRARWFFAICGAYGKERAKLCGGEHGHWRNEEGDARCEEDEDSSEEPGSGCGHLHKLGYSAYRTGSIKLSIITSISLADS